MRGQRPTTTCSGSTQRESDEWWSLHRSVETASSAARRSMSFDILPVTQGHWKWYRSNSYWRLIRLTMTLSCIISEIKLYIGRKSRFFHTPPAAFDAPLGGSRRTTAIFFCMEKLEWWDLQFWWWKVSRICLLVNNTQTWQTDRHDAVLCTASPAKWISVPKFGYFGAY